MFGFMKLEHRWAICLEQVNRNNHHDWKLSLTELSDKDYKVRSVKFEKSPMNLLKFKNIVFQINLLTGELNSKLNTVEEKLNKH